MKIKRKLILFGAGKNGKLALQKYGKDRVAYFCDNSAEKQGMHIEGIEIVSFSRMLELYQEGYIIMITPSDNAFLIGQLELEKIYDYLIFRNEELKFFLKHGEEEQKKYAYENSVINSLAEQSSKIDLLMDISEFKKLSSEALRLNREENLCLGHSGWNKEGHFYGNMHALMKYASIPEEEMKYFPLVSHNDGLPLYTTAFGYKSAVIFSGNYFRKKVHERAPYVPVFSVGPFIHYAENFYDESRIREEKNTYGKTLLAFLPHTIENVERAYSREQFIDEIVKIYGFQFSRILLCVYWADINDKVCDYAQEKGMHIVTAGFRFDVKFDSRLKTILELSDAIVCADIGTFIAYALYMGKPIARVDISDNQTIVEGLLKSTLERQIQLTDDYNAFGKKFYQLFDEKLKSTKAQKDWMNEVSGFDQIRDAEYIRRIFQISKDIWIQCEGNLEEYPEAVRQVYAQYNKHADIDNMWILKTAVGAYID